MTGARNCQVVVAASWKLKHTDGQISQKQNKTQIATSTAAIKQIISLSAILRLGLRSYCNRVSDAMNINIHPSIIYTLCRGHGAPEPIPAFILLKKY